MQKGPFAALAAELPYYNMHHIFGIINVLNSVRTRHQIHLHHLYISPALIVQFRFGLTLVPSQGMVQMDCAIDDLNLTDVFAADPIQWFHNGSIRLQDSGRITIDDTIPDPLPSRVTSTLEIDNVEITDAGEYECRVLFNSPSLQLQESLVLKVAGMD